MSYYQNKTHFLIEMLKFSKILPIFHKIVTCKSDKPFKVFKMVFGGGGELQKCGVRGKMQGIS